MNTAFFAAMLLISGYIHITVSPFYIVRGSSIEPLHINIRASVIGLFNAFQAAGIYLYYNKTVVVLAKKLSPIAHQFGWSLLESKSMVIFYVLLFLLPLANRLLLHILRSIVYFLKSVISRRSITLSTLFKSFAFSTHKIKERLYLSHDDPIDKIIFRSAHDKTLILLIKLNDASFYCGTVMTFTDKSANHKAESTIKLAIYANGFIDDKTHDYIVKYKDDPTTQLSRSSIIIKQSDIVSVAECPDGFIATLPVQNKKTTLIKMLAKIFTPRAAG